MTTNSKKLILSVILLFSIPLACSIPTFGQNATPTPEVMDPAAQQPGVDLGDMIATDATSGNTVITITEEQLNQMLTEKMASDPSAMLTEPVVTLRDERINITGKTVQAGMEFAANILIAIDVDAEGQPVINIESVKIGPLEAPDAVREVVSGLVLSMFNTAVGTGLSGMKMESVTINDGTMIVTFQQN